MTSPCVARFPCCLLRHQLHSLLLLKYPLCSCVCAVYIYVLLFGVSFVCLLVALLFVQQHLFDICNEMFRPVVRQASNSLRVLYSTHARRTGLHLTVCIHCHSLLLILMPPRSSTLYYLIYFTLYYSTLTILLIVTKITIASDVEVSSTNLICAGQALLQR